MELLLAIRNSKQLWEGCIFLKIWWYVSTETDYNILKHTEDIVLRDNFFMH